MTTADVEHESVADFYQSCRGHQLFGLWAIASQPFNEMVSTVNGMKVVDIRALQDDPPEPKQRADRPFSDRFQTRSQTVLEEEARGRRPVPIIDGTAIIELNGPLTKHETSFQSLFGGTSMLRTRRVLRQALANDRVERVLLLIDSPGGTVSGTHDLADDVHNGSKQKPIFTFYEDLGASAALCIGSQSKRQFANRSATLGSIGTLAVLYDQSQQAAELGIKVHVISTGFMKGAAEPGTEITEEQLEDFQRVVDSTFKQFRSDLMRGRGLTEDKVDKLATGQVWIGEEAVELGLVDGIRTIDQVLDEIKRSPAPRAQRRASMSDEQTPDTKAATLQELKAACPDAPSDFLLQCLEDGKTVQQATTGFAKHLSQQLESVSKERDELKQKAADTAGTETTTTTHGAPPLRTEDAAPKAGSGDAVEEFNNRVRALEQAGMPRADAVRQVVHDDPELHARYLDDYNAMHRRPGPQRVAS